MKNQFTRNWSHLFPFIYGLDFLLLWAGLPGPLWCEFTCWSVGDDRLFLSDTFPCCLWCPKPGRLLALALVCFKVWWVWLFDALLPSIFCCFGLCTCCCCFGPTCGACCVWSTTFGLAAAAAILAVAPPDDNSSILSILLELNNLLIAPFGINE